MHYRRVVVLARNKQMVMLFHVDTVDKVCHVDLPQLVDPMGRAAQVRYRGLRPVT